jgi:small subunit ribosomal protein S8
MDFAVGKILREAGYVGDVRKRVLDKKSFIDIDLLPKEEKPKLIERVRLISTPSKKVYVRHGELRPVRQGYGLGVVSTSAGVMTAMEAKKRRLGGEYLFEIW